MLGYIRIILDWYYRWNEGRNIFFVLLFWRYWFRFWWFKGDREGILVVFVLCLYFRDIWRGELDILICGYIVSMNLIILYCLISWCMLILKFIRFVLVNVGYVYFLWFLYLYEVLCKEIWFLLFNEFMNWRLGRFFFEKIISYWIYLLFFV